MPDSNRHAAQPPNKKFLFDVHVFDETGKDLNALPDVPPPPMFSESEMDDARAQSYEEGKKQGLADAAASRAQFIARQLESISAHFAALFSAEHMREKEYEHESVRLSLLMIEKIFPILVERIGQDELKSVITQILLDASAKGLIEIDVSADSAADINAHLRTKWPEGEKGPAFSVKGREDIKTGACKLSWADGGAVRNPEALIEKMQAQILSLLPSPANHAITNTDNPENGG